MHPISRAVIRAAALNSGTPATLMSLWLRRFPSVGPCGPITGGICKESSTPSLFQASLIGHVHIQVINSLGRHLKGIFSSVEWICLACWRVCQQYVCVERLVTKDVQVDSLRHSATNLLRLIKSLLNFWRHPWVSALKTSLLSNICILFHFKFAFVLQNAFFSVLFLTQTDRPTVTNAFTKSIRHTEAKVQDKKSAHDTRLSAR